MISLLQLVSHDFLGMKPLQNSFKSHCFIAKFTSCSRVYDDGEVLVIFICAKNIHSVFQGFDLSASLHPLGH